MCFSNTKKIYGENHPTIANTWLTLGIILGNTGDFNRALAFGEKALKIYLTLFGENHLNVACAYNSIGFIHGKKGNVKKEIAYRSKGLAIALKTGNKILAANSCNRVAHAYKKNQQKDLANTYFRQAAEKFRELGDEEQAQANLKEIEE